MQTPVPGPGSDGLAIVGPDHRVIFWDERVAELFGVPASEMIGHHALELVGLAAATDLQPDEALVAALGARLKALDDEQSTLMITRPGDPPRSLQIVTRPVHRDRAYRGTYILVRDVTAGRSVGPPEPVGPDSPRAQARRALREFAEGLLLANETTA
jgi:PAS domain-containing protein